MVAFIVAWAASATAMEQVRLRRGDLDRVVQGRVLVEAQDGGLLLQSCDGTLWVIQPSELLTRSSDETPFAALDQQQMSDLLLREMPEGFRIHRTAHYVVCYNTTEAYAHWCGGLYERLYRAFYTFWRNRGLPLEEPTFPLVALVFDSKSAFADYAQPELGESTSAIIGYYSVRTNRVTMYDLTGVDALGKIEGRINSTAHINQILSQPAAERTVATIVHEATHQLAYNSGMQTRYAANPYWLSEGMAVFFETPDFGNSRGWRTVGAVNRYNLAQFRLALPSRSEGSLASIISDDKLFRDPRTAPAAYAEAWALNYFLIRTRSRQYVEYVNRLATLEPLEELSAAERLTQFQEAFGDDLAELESDFLRYMQRVR